MRLRLTLTLATVAFIGGGAAVASAATPHTTASAHTSTWAAAAPPVGVPYLKGGALCYDPTATSKGFCIPLP